MIRYFFGEDTRTARAKIAAYANKSHAQVRFVDEDDMRNSPIEAIFDSAKGSLFGVSLLVFRDPLSYSEAVRTQIIEYCTPENMKGDSIFWQRGGADARSAVHKFLKKNAEVEQFPAIGDIQQGVRWIQNYIKEGGMKDDAIEQDAMISLVQRVGFDTYALASELQKLVAYKEVVTKDDVESIVPERSSAVPSAFPLLEAITAKKPIIATNILQSMIAGGASERFITSMIAYQFRLFLAVRMGIDNNESASVISKQSKFHPIAVQKATPIVRRLSVPVIQDALVRIAGVERSMNSNKTMDPRSIVTMLVIGLAS
ncbi:MAG: hypothetical protein K8Q97_02595 [Candidatus Andersenbacteria bacterium]|nr:hypothetical protein [Candidatus Andersenbacteria bacterium]